MALVPRVVATMVAAFVLSPAGAAHAAPLIDSTILKGGAISGRTVELQVRASDPQAPVSGMVVGFGAGESGYGLSNCLPPDYRGRAFGPVAAPGRKVTLAAPHTFPRPGTRTVVAKVTSGGCTPEPTSTAQGIQVQVVPPGTQPAPITLLPPVTVPTVPPLPELPTLPALPSLPVALPAAGCPNRHRWFSRTRRGERQAKVALLCLLNRERRRRGLHPLRANRKLARAARAHARDMVRFRFFAHIGRGRTTPTQRLYRARYLPGRGRWAVGENLGFGTGAMTRPAAIHSAWMHSTLHRAAMLGRRFREVGFGIYPGIPFQSRGATFTAEFATTR